VTADRPRPSAEDRFWAKVAKTDDGCWTWTGANARGGYGSYKTRARTFRAHRYAYEAVRGPIPAGLYLDHLCHNADPTCPGGDTCKHRRCVNPDHLEPVTPHENVLRGLATAALNAAKTHCPQGHEYTPENTYRIKPSPNKHHGARSCRACRRLATARYDAKRRRKPAA